MILNQFGIIARNEWYKLPKRFNNLQLDVFQIMPNHLHCIIILKGHHIGATLAVAPNDNKSVVAPNNNDPVVAPNDNDLADAPDDAAPADAPNDHAPADAPNDHAPADAPNEHDGAGASPAPKLTPISNPTVGDIVGAYKSLVAHECLKKFESKNKKMGKLWQRNYYEHIIRNHQAYKTIANYIMNNPARWNDDKFFMGS
jgi:REP element-mobilizing transposase RayT